MKRLLKFSLLCFLAACTTNAGSRSSERSPDYLKCVRGDLDACVAYAKAQPQGRDQKTTRAAIVSYQYACFLDQPDACLEIGRIYGASSVLVTRKSQLESHKKACAQGRQEACVLYADGIPQNKAITIYKTSCENEYGPACTRYAALLKKNWRFLGGLEKAIAVEKKACDLGDDAGCFALGQSYFFGSGIEKNADNARIYFEKSCNQKTGAGCLALAKIYEKGIGIQPNLKQANIYYELAEKHERVSVAQTPQSAYLIFVDACNYGDTLGCFNAGWFLAQGLEIKRNITTAREFFQRACDEGLNSACKRRDKVTRDRSTTTEERSKTEVIELDREGNKITK